LSEEGDIVWFDEVLEGGLGPCRGSGIFEAVNGKWVLQQYVLSILVDNKDNKDVKDVLELKWESNSVFIDILL